MDSTQTAERADYSQDYWNQASENNHHSSPSADNWDEWKARQSHGSVIYNPDFIQAEKTLTIPESHQKQESPEATKGRKTPTDEPENQDYQVYLDDESDHECDVIVDGTVMAEEETEEDVRDKETGEIEDEEEEKPSPEKNSNKAPTTKIGPLLKKSSDGETSSPSPQPKKRKRSRSPLRKSRRSRSRSRKVKKTKRRSRSSSRDTFDGIGLADVPAETIRCNQCNRLFATAHDASVHEIRSHETRIPCAVCTKILTSPAKLVIHIEKHHATEKLRCRFCDEKFGGRAETLSHAQWNDFREHVFREMLRRKVKDYNNRCPDTTALRGVGRCPHGPPIKCRNFPKCPGARCIYSHGRCDFAGTCSNSDCPFDHPCRPRVCMACVKDLKSSNRRRTRSPPSRTRE